MSEAAFREAALASGTTRALVYNLPANTATAWRIDRRAQPPVATAAALHPAVTAELDAAHQLYTAMGTLQPVINVQASALERIPSIAQRTARDVLADNNLRGMLESALGDGDFIERSADPALVAALARLWHTRATALDLRAQSALIYRVRFADGSRAEFANTPGLTLARYREDSAIAADGRPVPGAQAADGR